MYTLPGDFKCYHSFHLISFKGWGSSHPKLSGQQIGIKFVGVLKMNHLHRFFTKFPRHVCPKRNGDCFGVCHLQLLPFQHNCLLDLCFCGCSSDQTCPEICTKCLECLFFRVIRFRLHMVHKFSFIRLKSEKSMKTQSLS